MLFPVLVYILGWSMYHLLQYPGYLKAVVTCLKTEKLQDWVALFLVQWLIVVPNRICEILEDVLYYRWVANPLKKSVFIVGIPRSGTSHAHKLLTNALPSSGCCSMRLVDILYPSFLGCLVGPIINPFIVRVLSVPNHPLSAYSYEEEDDLGIHAYRGLLFLSFFSEKFVMEYIQSPTGPRFTEADPAHVEVMYRSIVKRCKRTGSTVFVGKPLFSSSSSYYELKRRFKDKAVFVLMHRHPEEVKGSLASLLNSYGQFSLKNIARVTLVQMKSSYLGALDILDDFGQSENLLSFVWSFERYIKSPSKHIMVLLKRVFTNESFGKLLSESLDNLGSIQDPQKRYETHSNQIAASEVELPCFDGLWNRVEKVLGYKIVQMESA